MLLGTLREAVPEKKREMKSKTTETIYLSATSAYVNLITSITRVILYIKILCNISVVFGFNFHV